MTDREVANLVEWIERLSVLEVKVARLPDIEAKLDELIALRHKGMGAFWLASSLIGAGIIGAILTFISWIKGVH